MGRIRSIKPDFPQSESVGRLSIPARLLFVQLWTLADDSGRLRGNSRMLASLLYPFDDLSANDIDGWLAELEREGCVRAYAAGGSTYLEVCNWRIHQRIDKPQPSKLPAFSEDSRIFLDRSANDPRSIRDGLDWKGSGEGREGKGQDDFAAPSAAAPRPGGEALPLILEAEDTKDAESPEAGHAARRRGVRTRAGTDGAGAQESPPVAPTAESWAAYTAAYARNYGAAPLRNATTNSQMAQFVRRVGADEAPAIAGWFVGHPGVRYVQGGHTVGLLLADAEKLRTEFVTGRVRAAIASGRQAALESRNARAVEDAVAAIVGAAEGGAHA